jgi:phage pi2 protein 07
MEMVTIPKEEYEELKRQAKNRPLWMDIEESLESAKREGLIRVK